MNAMQTPHAQRPSTLLFRVSFLDGRYHGDPEWPPSPARLFQALLAGVAGTPGAAAAFEALGVLERSDPPWILAPLTTNGQRRVSYVPSNDADEALGNSEKLARIRTEKSEQPRLFDADDEIVYGWNIDTDDVEHARQLERSAKHLFQLGRGKDFAWARAEWCDAATAARLIAEHSGVVHRPSTGAGAQESTLFCPTAGTLESLIARHEALANRTSYEAVSSRKTVTVLDLAPSALLRTVSYTPSTARWLFDLRHEDDHARFETWSGHATAQLVTALRDAAAQRLREASADYEPAIELALIGTRTNKQPPGERRVRIVPLPSIGHRYADRAIRRVVVEVPSSAALSADDVRWACSNQVLTSPAGSRVRVVPASDDTMLRHYVDESTIARTWRTVTPVIVPGTGATRRKSAGSEARTGADESARRATAEEGIRRAIRHSIVDATLVGVEVQRQAFEPKGLRIDRAVADTRFAASDAWHARLTFRRPPGGPLLLGNGRFLGLGLFAPERPFDSRWLSFRIVEGAAGIEEPERVAKALRRATLARVQRTLGRRAPIPPLISGHSEDGSKLEASGSHLMCACSARLGRLFLHLPTSNAGWNEQKRAFELLTQAMAEMDTLLAGRDGVLTVRFEPAAAADSEIPFVSTRWRTETPYTVNRHERADDAAGAVRRDVARACRRRGLPVPESIRVQNLQSRSGRGLMADVELEFAVAVEGPLLLGRTRHVGGGFFLPTEQLE